MPKKTHPTIGSFDIGADKPKQVLAEDASRVYVIIYNNGSETVELLSSPHQKAGDGFPIPPGTCYDNEHCQGDYWMISTSGTQNIRIEEDSE